jgi:hypothetical protein
MDRQAQRDIRRKLNCLQFAQDCGNVLLTCRKFGKKPAGWMAEENVIATDSPWRKEKISPHVTLKTSPTAKPVTKPRQPVTMGAEICSRDEIHRTAVRMTTNPTTPVAPATKPLNQTLSAVEVRNSMAIVKTNMRITGTVIHT